jgi:hypothetical protein
MGSSGAMRALFRFEGAVRRHPAVVAWLAAHADPLGVAAARWLEHGRALGPDVLELVHDGQPTLCVDGAAFLHVATYRAHAAVGFFQGAALPDPGAWLEGRGRFMRHVKLRVGPDAPPVDEGALSALVEAAYADVRARLADEG